MREEHRRVHVDAYAQAGNEILLLDVEKQFKTAGSGLCSENSWRAAVAGVRCSSFVIAPLNTHVFKGIIIILLFIMFDGSKNLRGLTRP